MIGITPLGDTQRYGLTDAALQTTSGTFVAPDTASLQATASLLQPDPTTGTWPIPYNEFAQPAGAAVYPGTMVVYAAVPTSGLPATDAQDYAALLQFAATTGQTPGSAVGQLPSGYLPLTQADGLGTLAAYTSAAALDVAAQNGQVPSVTGATSGGSPPKSSTAPGSTSSSEPGQDSGRSVSTVAGQASPTTVASLSSSGPSHSAKRHVSSQIASSIGPLGLTPRATLWTGGALIVIVLILSLSGVFSVPAAYRVGRRRRRW
jgi:hypothetical protein